MNDPAENKVSEFYNSIGWELVGKDTEDARRWEDLRKCASEYARKTRLRVLKHIPEHGKYMLDMASGPIQYPEYLAYSATYEKRYCIDLSLKALQDAKRKIGGHGVFLHGSFFDLNLEENFFDCTLSLHTIYHIDQERQEEAVRKLLHVTKPGKPVIIIYSNPKPLIKHFKFLLRILKRIKNIKKRNKQQELKPLYFYAHPIEWWDRYKDIAEVSIISWRSLKSIHQKILIPDNRIGEIIFRTLFRMEDMFPHYFAKHFQYPMIILTKKY